MKKVNVDDITKKGFKYKITPRSKDTVIAEGIDLVFDTLEEAMLKTEEYVTTGRIFGGPTQIKEVSIN